LLLGKCRRWGCRRLYITTHQYARAYYDRGNAYARLDQCERAIQELDEAIRLDPQYVSVYFSRGLAYEAIGKSEEAKRDFAKAKELGQR